MQNSLILVVALKGSVLFHLGHEDLLNGLAFPATMQEACLNLVPEDNAEHYPYTEYNEGLDAQESGRAGHEG